MRIIKFRAWHKKTKKMYEVRELCYTPSGQLWVSAINEYKDGKFYKATRDLEWGIDVSAELMQFTGLKDKNGVEVYEGDIVKGKNRTFREDEATHVGIVEYHGMGFVIVNQNKITARGGEIYLNDDLEVIGNIYENPELL